MRLVGVTLDGAFYPRTAADATGALTLTKGLVALAPLSPVDAQDALQGAALASEDADEAWTGLGRHGE